MLAAPTENTLYEHSSSCDPLSLHEEFYYPSLYQYLFEEQLEQKLPGRTGTAEVVSSARIDNSPYKESTAIMKTELKQPLHEGATCMQPPLVAAAKSTKSRPSPLVLLSSFGSTGLKSADLKQRICDASPAASVTITQIPIDERQPLPPTPLTPFSMGNKPSSLPANLVADDKSFRSVVRRDSRQPISRKSSFNIFKRVDSKSPLSRDVTASVMSILHRDSYKKDESSATDDDGLVGDDSHLDQPNSNSYHGYCSHMHDMRPALHSASTVTMTDERASLPLSAASTIRDCRSTSQSPVQLAQANGADDTNGLPPIPPAEDEAMSTVSPIIPAPSPLPEDSPHKYGLHDKTDTPEVPDPVTEDIKVIKMRRKSSGLEIFNEAKTLQSAQSFLNGLSTSRRRAESAAAIRATDNSGTAKATSCRSKSGSASIRPPSAQSPHLPRQRGYNFKLSGFAYSRPLILAQVKCYRGHARLVLSRNKHAPVECAVCHIDSDGDHFSCSWCALRMCRFCRDDFSERGIGALRERIRKAELGAAVDFADSSSIEENYPELWKMKSAEFT